MTGFTKLFSSLVYSTVWREDMHVKVVWITMLALADRNGRVLASLPGLADAARVSIDQCQDALGRLASPDQWSRTKAFDGKRVQEVDGGWQLLNYLKYRELRNEDERRIQTREAVRRHRGKPSKQSKQSKPRKAHAEAEAEADLQDQDQRAPHALKKVRSHLRRAIWNLLEQDGGTSISELTNTVKTIAAKDLRVEWSANEIAGIVDEVLAQWDKRQRGATSGHD